jgi:excisionase family DNA binding protein
LTGGICEKKSNISRKEVLWLERLLNVKETAQILGVGVRKCHDMFRAKVLPGFKVVGEWRISPKALQEYIDSRGVMMEEKGGE